MFRDDEPKCGSSSKKRRTAVIEGGVMWWGKNILSEYGGCYKEQCGVESGDVVCGGEKKRKPSGVNVVDVVRSYVVWKVVMW